MKKFNFFSVYTKYIFSDKTCRSSYKKLCHSTNHSSEFVLFVAYRMKFESCRGHWIPFHIANMFKTLFFIDEVTGTICINFPKIETR